MDLKKEALAYHKGRGNRSGKIGTEILSSVDSKEDLILAYTPGVAVPCLEISEDKSLAYDYTNKGNSVAVISNGTSVLGLGNIGVLASKPVMEGKALLFKHFGDIDAVDVLIDSEDTEEIVRTVELISVTYGGINLEDFKAPECFEIEARLKKSLGIPVFHDDQHGTAVVVGAGLLNALKIATRNSVPSKMGTGVPASSGARNSVPSKKGTDVPTSSGKNMNEIKVVINGAGAAGVAIGKMLFNLGVAKKNLIMCDSKGVVYVGREFGVGSLGYKKEFAVETDKRSLVEAVDGSDVFVGVSKAGLLTSEMLKSMRENPIVFAMANPDPEIGWDLAKETRDDVIMSTGRSDFPNQVNNVLAFPGIFRGALDSRAHEINEEMKVAAVEALAGLIAEPTKDSFIVDLFDRRILPKVAFRVAEAAVDSGVAMDGFDLDEYGVRLKERFLE